MSLIKNLRQRRQTHRDHRAIERALQSAPTQSMRDEIAIIVQRQMR